MSRSVNDEVLVRGPPSRIEKRLANAPAVAGQSILLHRHLLAHHGWHKFGEQLQLRLG